jgi:hypothetical protein
MGDKDGELARFDLDVIPKRHRRMDQLTCGATGGRKGEKNS